MTYTAAVQATQEEKDSLALASDYEGLKFHPGWQHLRKLMDSWVLEAQEAARKSGDDPFLPVLRWNNRVELVQALDHEIESRIAHGRRLQEEIEESERSNKQWQPQS